MLARAVWGLVALLPVRVADADGRAIEPLAVRGGPAAVLVFVGVDCPISNAYAPDLRRIMADHPAVPFYLVYTGATAAAAKAHAAAYGYACPALVDPRHLLADRVGATVTPEVAVVADGGRVLYRGRVDDRYVTFGRKRPAATTHDLTAALDAVLGARPVPVAITRAVGCPI